jgi:hypothetical protein
MTTVAAPPGSPLDEFTSRTVWRWGGYGDDTDWPGIISAGLRVLCLYGLLAVTTAGNNPSTAMRKLWQAIAELHSWGGREHVTDITAWLKSLLLAIREPQHTPDPRHSDAPPGGAQDVIHQVAPTRGAPIPAGAIASGSNGRPP